MKICLMSLIAVGWTGVAFAAPTPPTTQIMGTVAGASVVAGNTDFVCTLEDGLGEFQRPARSAARPNPRAIIAIPRIAKYNGQTGGGYQSSSGVVVLNFTSPVAGRLQIDYDSSKPGSNLPSGEAVPFRAYREVWNPSTSTLQVAFSIVFDHCTLPVEALFRAAS